MTNFVASNVHKESALVILFIFIFVLAFEFLPIVKEAQSYVSYENYQNKDITCDVLLDERPWYGKLNHWFFVWVIFVPAMIFLFPPGAVAWLGVCRTILAVITCHVSMYLAVDLQWHIRNAPFYQDPFQTSSERAWRMDCMSYDGDGFSYIFSIFLGWIPAYFYAGICFWIGHFYHRKFSKKIAKPYEADVIMRRFPAALKIYLFIVLVWLFFVALHKANLFEAKFVGILYYLTLRPLLIPVEIFFYK